MIKELPKSKIVQYGLDMDVVEKELSKLKIRDPRFTVREVVWPMLNDRREAYKLKKQWGLCRNDWYSMCDLLIREKRWQQALEFIIIVLYVDLSGMINNNGVLRYDSVNTAPRVVSYFLDMYEKANMNLEKFLEFVQQTLNSLDPGLPFCYFNDETFYEILCEILKEKPENKADVLSVVRGLLNLEKYKSKSKKPEEGHPNYFYIKL